MMFYSIYWRHFCNDKVGNSYRVTFICSSHADWLHSYSSFCLKHGKETKEMRSLSVINEFGLVGLTENQHTGRCWNPHQRPPSHQKSPLVLLAFFLHRLSKNCFRLFFWITKPQLGISFEGQLCLK